ncbi:MAG: ribonuclease PH [Gemmatimonadota bacterium]
MTQGISRSFSRGPDDLRPVSVELGAAPYAEGSCLIAMGSTRVLCSASVEETAPGWRRGSGKGWVTAEYAMLPRATHTRTSRERGNLGGRTQEIQRLVGRSLRACVDLAALGERTIRIDCDVLQADGGTRTAAITGGSLALQHACDWLVHNGLLSKTPFRTRVAAVSVGVVGGDVLLDLDYSEDSVAEVDLNVVALDGGGLVEVQGTAERAPFSVEQLQQMVSLANGGIGRLFDLQRDVLGS